MNLHSRLNLWVTLWSLRVPVSKKSCRVTARASEWYLTSQTLSVPSSRNLHPGHHVSLTPIHHFLVTGQCTLSSSAQLSITDCLQDLSVLIQYVDTLHVLITRIWSTHKTRHLANGREKSERLNRRRIVYNFYFRKLRKMCDLEVLCFSKSILDLFLSWRMMLIKAPSIWEASLLRFYKAQDV